LFMANRKIFFVAGWLFPFVLAGLFFWKGTQFDPAVYEPPVVEEDAAFPIPVAVDEWTLSGGESLPADQMYERINGRASYYIQYGATALHYGEWAAAGEKWDMYLYEFASATGARGAFDGESSSTGRELTAIKGYSMPGQVAAVFGTFYLQMSAYQPGADTAAAEKLAATLALRLGGSSETVDKEETERTPSVLAGEAVVLDSRNYLPENAFGFSAFQDVRSVRVVLDGTETVWFRATNGSGRLMAYVDELTEYGGDELFRVDGGTGGSMFGSWEFAAAADDALWGVRDAASKEILLKHWSAMKNALEAK
jgi:hypothetical protein